MNLTIETTVCREDDEVDVTASGSVYWEPDEWLRYHVVEDLVTSIPVSSAEYDQLERELIAAYVDTLQQRREDAAELWGER